MYKLQYMNVIREVATETERDSLIAAGYALIEDKNTTDDSKNKTSENEISQDSDISEEQSEDNTDEKVSQTDDSTTETSENEISQDSDISEEQSEDNTDETDENKSGKKSSKAKK